MDLVIDLSISPELTRSIVAEYRSILALEGSTPTEPCIRCKVQPACLCLECASQPDDASDPGTGAGAPDEGAAALEELDTGESP